MILFPLLPHMYPNDVFRTSIILTATLQNKNNTSPKQYVFVCSKRELEFVMSESLPALELCTAVHIG